MGRIICIDYGRRRCGFAATDILSISAHGLPTVRTCDLQSFLTDYIQKEPVDRIIVGLPKKLNGEPSESERYIRPFLQWLAKTHPDMPVERVDERFTSTIAHREMLAAGMKKSQRQEKGKADEMAAVLILNTYLDSQP